MLTWHTTEGHYGALDVSGLSVVMVGYYDDDEAGAPWRVFLYVDEGASEPQVQGLSNIFLGRSGGHTGMVMGRNISEVYGVRPAKIELDHTKNAERIQVEEVAYAATGHPHDTGDTVTCGIPGHDQPGDEIVVEEMWVSDDPLRFKMSGRCGFVSNFDYRS